MKINRMGQDEFHVSMAYEEARILINAMKATTRELGDDFETRVGATIEEATAIVSQLEAASR
jgi:hypothetical protein